MTNESYKRSFSRNIGILSEAEQERLAGATVVLAGLGGIGGNTLIQLARSGVGNFRLADFDRFDDVNINRQYGARTDTRGRLKCEVMAAEVKAINPAAEVTLFPAGFTADNAEELLSGADLAVDAIDFYAIETHLEFHRATRAHGLYTLMGSPVGFSACLQIFDPRGMSFEEYCAIKPEMDPLEKQLRYACGLVPELLHIDYFDVSLGRSNTDFLNRAGPSLSVACSLAASLVASEAVLILLGRRKPRAIPYTYQFDQYTYRYAQTHIDGGMANYDPGPAIDKIKDRSSFVPQVLELFYHKKRSRKAAVNGVDLYYKVEGEGKPVLMISPLGADASFWARQTQELAKHFRVITFDNRGSGVSSPCVGDCSTELMAEDAIRLLEFLAVDSAHVVGLALGGLIAQQIAARRPDLVDRLVLASSYLHADERIEAVTRQWRELAVRQGMEPLFDACLEYLFSPGYIADNDGELDKLKTFYRLTLVDPQSFCSQSLAGVRHDSRTLARQVTAPTLVLHGRGDRLVDPALGEALAESLGNAESVLFDDAPHFFIWEYADRFNAEVVDFLRG
jgi:pimeloyl-ACP methyl ester carboxylesterase/molybdopterin/thiamine biosynthesis adenylyltransferase